MKERVGDGKLILISAETSFKLAAATVSYSSKDVKLNFYASLATGAVLVIFTASNTDIFIGF